MIYAFFSDSMGGLDNLGVCIRNCAQCKKMYGTYFEGQMCADACVKFKGKIIPGTLKLNDEQIQKVVKILKDLVSVNVFLLAIETTTTKITIFSV